MNSSLRLLAGVIIGLTPLSTYSQSTAADSIIHLKEYVTATGKIIDFNYNKLLVVDEGPVSNPRIFDILTNTTQAIPYPGQIQGGFVTQQGAVLLAVPATAGPHDSLYDFNNGVLYPVAAITKNSARVAGNYCLWAQIAEDPQDLQKDSLFRRNLVTRQDSLIASYTVWYGQLGASSEVAANGLVVYTDSVRNLIKFQNNTYTSITNYPGGNSGEGAANPLTDGYNIVYQEWQETTSRIVTTGPQGDVALTEWDRDVTAFPVTGYQVNNKYVVYNHQKRYPPDYFFVDEIWLRDPTGQATQLPTVDPNFNRLELLNPSGDVMIFSKNSPIVSDTRWLTSRNHGIRKVDSSAGKTYYRDTAWYIAIGNILYSLDFPDEEKPPIPVMEGLKASYCSTEGQQNVKLLNLPGDSGSTTVQVTLDTTLLAVASTDSTFAFNVSDLSAGSHMLIISYSNSSGSTADTANFSIYAAVTPVVKLLADITTVSNLPLPVTLTATNTAGGGIHPLYTFARDRNFSNILQAQNANNTLHIMPAELSWGPNKIYVRMLSSDSCYTMSTAIDSIIVWRHPFNGIPDGNHRLIKVLPNPFNNRILVVGLNDDKSYVITLYRANSMQVLQRQVTNRNLYQLYCPDLQAGIYLLRIYDQTNGKVLGTLRLLKRHDH